MKATLILRLLSPLLFLLFYNITIYAQLFETTIGSLVGSDETTDIKPLPNRHTIVLANTESFGPQKILLIELDPTGGVVFFKTIFEVTNPDVEYSGNGLELDLDAAGNPIGYFITGCRGPFPIQTILIRTDLNGNPTWARQMDVIVDPNNSSTECGVSLERQANRDIIVVGRSILLGDFRFTVSRFSPAGVMIWSYRYGSDRGLQFYPNESCNGKRGGLDVVAVVGHIHDTAGIGHTFLSCIRSSNGAEIWRSQYNSEHYHDDGTDVVQNPANNRFMVVGHANNLPGNSNMWVFKANANNGTLANGATYSLLPPYINLFARDVCLSPDIKSGTITGFIDYVNPFGDSETRTFIMKLPFAPAAVPVFSHYFTDSEPLIFLFGDDAIETVGGANPGYVLGTHAILPGSIPFDYDVHALRLNALGMHNFIDCPAVTFTPRIEEEGRAIRLKRDQTESRWSDLTVHAEFRNYIEEPCIEFVPPPQMELVLDHSASTQGIHLYPNPVRAGSEVNIEFETEGASEIELQLFDMTGRLISQWREFRNEGKQVVQFPLPDVASDNMYLVRLVFPDGRYQIVRLFVN